MTDILAAYRDRLSIRPLADLRPYDNNSRTHDAAQVDHLLNLMLEFGVTNPILADKGGIVAGHGRKLAAMKAVAAGQKLRLPSGDELPFGHFPVLDCTGWSEEQRRAYIIADNQSALMAGWDISMLKLEAQALNLAGFDLGMLGFDDKMMQGLLATPTEGETDPDAVPEPLAQPVSMLGDVWLLGKHRLVCGSSTTVEAVDAALNGVVPELMVTDPPYGVNYKPENRAKGLKDGAQRATGKVANDHEANWQDAWALFPGSVAYVWHAGIRRFEVELSLREADFDVRAEIVWRKSKATLSPGNIAKHSSGYNWQHETCLYAVKKGRFVDWNGDKSQTTVWDIEHAKSETGHSTQKPVEAMLRPIQNNSSAGQAVYDPFVGSGTTIIACEMSGRACHAIELLPAFVDVGVLRWQQFTAATAILEATGQTFVEVMAERCPETSLQPAAPAAKARKPRASRKGASAA